MFATQSSILKARNSSTGRFQWLDSVRGMAVIWIALFHCLLSYGSGSLPSPISFGSFCGVVQQCAQGSSFGNFSCAVEAIIAAIIQRGSLGVGVFILFSGFGLTYSLVKRGRFETSWAVWYRRRLTRIFPVYWLAHLVFLVSPFAVLHDPVDYRFLLSLLGDRVYPVDKMFFYLVPAWWFLGLLIEFYIVFPLLFKLMQRLGWVKYLGLCILLSSGTRYVLTDVVEANGYYEMGAFFVCRLWEFAAGMTMGKLMGEAPDWTLGRLLSWKGFFAGVILFTLGLVSYQPNFLSSFSDGLTAMGLSLILMHLAYRLDRIPGLGRWLAWGGVYSYSIYLFHQPYVMYVGEKLRPYSLAVFLILANALLVLIAAISMCFEYTVNRTVNLFFAKDQKKS
jgi:peptidoglycan/LPS O-acetylase OafA/YrhL